MRVARQDLLGEGQDALYVEIVDGRGMFSIRTAPSSWRSLSRCRV